MYVCHSKRDVVRIVFLLALMRLTFGGPAPGLAQELGDSEKKSFKLPGPIRQLFVQGRGEKPPPDVGSSSRSLIFGDAPSIYGASAPAVAPMPNATFVDAPLPGKTVNAATLPDSVGAESPSPDTLPEEVSLDPMPERPSRSRGILSVWRRFRPRSDESTQPIPPDPMLGEIIDAESSVNDRGNTRIRRVPSILVRRSQPKSSRADGAAAPKRFRFLKFSSRRSAPPRAPMPQESIVSSSTFQPTTPPDDAAPQLQIRQQPAASRPAAELARPQTILRPAPELGSARTPPRETTPEPSTSDANGSFNQGGAAYLGQSDVRQNQPAATSPRSQPAQLQMNDRSASPVAARRPAESAPRSPESLAAVTRTSPRDLDPSRHVKSTLPSQPADLPAVSQLSRPRVIVRPAVPGRDAAGRKILGPRVVMAEGIMNSVRHVMQDAEPLTAPPAEIIPAPSFADSVLSATPMEVSIPESAPYCGDCHPFSRGFHRLLALMKVESGGDMGVGYERLEYAPFEIEISQPLNNIRFRLDSGSNWAFPDRAEYFWASSPINQAETQPGQVVDYQDLRFMWEVGGKRFSVATEIPIRIIDPDNAIYTPAENTAGMGDMSLTTKTVLLDGDVWQITQVMRTQFNTGTVRHGRGTGHIALEPGLLGRIRWRPKTYLHGQCTYLFPVGANLLRAGQVLKYGLAVSHLWFDADNFAVIPTLEFVGWTVLDGSQSIDGGGGVPFFVPVDGLGIFNIHPGIRFVHDKGGDCGLFEFGLSAGLAVSDDSWYEELLRIECRWSY